MNNTDFMVNFEGLSDKGTIIIDEASKLKQALNDVNSARVSLDGWVSTNKDEYDSKVVGFIPKMEEMVSSIESFGKVAKQTSEKIVSVEKQIHDDMNDNIAA